MPWKLAPGVADRDDRLLQQKTPKLEKLYPGPKDRSRTGGVSCLASGRRKGRRKAPISFRERRKNEFGRSLAARSLEDPGMAERGEEEEKPCGRGKDGG